MKIYILVHKFIQVRLNFYYKKCDYKMSNMCSDKLYNNKNFQKGIEFLSKRVINTLVSQKRACDFHRVFCHVSQTRAN